MREFLAVFSGNELIFGTVLGVWLLLTGAGSWLGRTASRLKDPLTVLIVAQVLIALLPIADVFLLRSLRNVVFIRGAAVGLTETVASCIVLLAPYCLVTGYLLTLASSILATRKDSASTGQVYFLDNVGDVVGGLLFSFVLVFWFNHFQILYFPALLNLLFAGLLLFRFKAAGCSRPPEAPDSAAAPLHNGRTRSALRRSLLCVAVVAMGVVLCRDLDQLSTELQYTGQHVLYEGNSPYGRLIVTETSGQHNFIHNGVVLFSTHNVEQIEETVHYAMAQRPDAGRVLLVSGGVSGTAREILKYGVAHVDYVELDPLIIRVAQRYLPGSLDDARIRVVNTDGRFFVRQPGHRYGVAIVNVPDPSSSQLNRFYTREFFGEVSARLTADGVLCISLGRYENYLGPELAKLIAVAHQTLRQVFDNVVLVPGRKVYFLASDGPLVSGAADIAERIEGKGIDNRFVNRHYLRDVLGPLRLAGVRRAISSDAAVNTDFAPVLYYHHLRYWMSQFKVRLGFLIGVLTLILAAWIIHARPVSLAMFTTGLAASTLEVVLMMGFQILCGCLYHQVGLIVAMFMLGLGIGSFTMNRLLAGRSRRDLVKLEFAIAVYAVCLPFLLIALGKIQDPGVATIAAQVAIPMLALVLGALVGLEFPLAGKLDFHTVSGTASRLYTADYLGAALGALLVSTLLIPLLGVTTVCVLAAALNLASGVLLWRSKW